MKILLPPYFDRNSMYSLIGQVIDEEYVPKYHKIVFNAYQLRFIQPSGVTVLSNLIQWLIRRKVNVNIDYPKLEEGDTGKKDPIKYLDDSGFFQYYGGGKLYENSSLRGTTLPLRHVAYEEYHSWLESAFIPWFMYQLGVSRRDTVENIKICLQEIFNNIKDHSTENIGCVFVQHYPNKGHIVVTASDFGVGIPAMIRQKEGEIDDASALVLAIKEGYSTRTLPSNTGAGLDILVSNIVRNNQGTVHIHSNKGILSCCIKKNKFMMTSKNRDEVYPGTLFEIIINTDRFCDNTTKEEEFTWF